MNKAFFLNLIKEAIGYESGFFRTIVDLYKNPIIVVESAISNDSKYVNPVKFLVSVCSYFIFVNGFLVDWETLAFSHLKELNYLITGETQMGEVEMIASKFMAIGMTTGLIPYLFIVIIVQLYILTKKNNSDKIEFYKTILFYYNGLNILYYFIFNLISIVCPPKYFFVFLAIYSLLAILGIRKLYETKPLTAYFENKEDITFVRRAYNKSLFFITGMGFLIGIILILMMESGMLNFKF